MGYGVARRYEFRAPGENKTLVLPPDAAAGAGQKLDFELGASLFARGHLRYSFGGAKSAAGH